MIVPTSVQSMLSELLHLRREGIKGSLVDVFEYNGVLYELQLTEQEVSDDD